MGTLTTGGKRQCRRRGGVVQQQSQERLQGTAVKQWVREKMGRHTCVPVERFVCRWVEIVVFKKLSFRVVGFWIKLEMCWKKILPNPKQFIAELLLEQWASDEAERQKARWGAQETKERMKRKTNLKEEGKKYGNPNRDSREGREEDRD